MKVQPIRQTEPGVTVQPLGALWDDIVWDETFKLHDFLTIAFSVSDRACQKAMTTLTVQ